ncbi:hypothetical protein DFH09DRAFT_1312864 [Mycena vulgaris]|nr:hypothetical protein DFH09DRAFT_1312864 [Mycena vulgaris]
MAINPHLMEATSSPSSPTLPRSAATGNTVTSGAVAHQLPRLLLRPLPRLTYRPLPRLTYRPDVLAMEAGTLLEMASVGGFNFPISTPPTGGSFGKPSALFGAFVHTKSMFSATTPPLSRPFFGVSRLTIGTPPPPLPSFAMAPEARPTPGGPTIAARALTTILEEPPQPLVTYGEPVEQTWAAAHDTLDEPDNFFGPRPLPLIASNAVAGAATESTVTNMAKTTQLLPGSRPRMKPPVMPRVKPAVAAPVPPITPIVSLSHPVTKAPKKKAPAKKPTGGLAAVKKAAAAAKVVEMKEKAGEVGEKRGRGRPRKAVEDAVAAAPPPALTDATNTVDAPQPAPQLTYSITNNNRAGAKRAAAETAAADAAAAQAALQAQCARGWMTTPNPNGNTDTVILTNAPRPPACERRPKILCDGSVATRQVKGKRAPKNPHAATEEALLARSAATKRKSAQEGEDVHKSKKRKTA